MKKYLAKLMFNIHQENDKEQSQFDEQIRLIEAVDYESAFFKARTIGKKEEVDFQNQKNKKVSWEFIDVFDLLALDNFKDGEQIYSSTHEEQNTNSFTKFIKESSMLIQVKNLTFA